MAYFYLEEGPVDLNQVYVIYKILGYRLRSPLMEECS
jgi:hypothetical protein